MPLPHCAMAGLRETPRLHEVLLHRSNAEQLPILIRQREVDPAREHVARMALDDQHIDVGFRCQPIECQARVDGFNYDEPR